MLTISETNLIQAAILSNFLYGALLITMAPTRTALDAGGTLWVTITGAAGHLLHASMVPADEMRDGTPPLLLLFDIVLVFASLFMFVLTFPRVARLAIDCGGALLGV